MKTYLRSQTVYKQSFSNIDRENGIIKDVTLCQIGEAKGHDLFLNDDFINEVVNLGNASEIGIKARFGHPNLCTTALGTYLGRYKNFRKVDDKAIADLYLDKTAKNSPNGNLYNYVLDLAESNPDMFGASIAFKSGKPLKEVVQVDDEEVERNFATINGLYAADLVDDPAATNSLFKTGYTNLVEVAEDDLAFHATVFLDEHPEILELLKKKPDVLNEFLKNYLSNKPKDKPDKPTAFTLKDEITNLKKWISDTFSKGSQTEPVEVRAVDLKKEFNIQLSELESQYQQQIDQLQSELNKSKAFPTLPDKKSDPQLSIKKKQEKDDTGKVLLKHIPDNVKRKLKEVKK